MMECTVLLTMKDGKMESRRELIAGKGLMSECEGVAQNAYNLYPEAEKVVVRVYGNDKEKFQKTFICSELTNKQIREINDWVVDIDVDVDDLESAKYVSNIYGVEPQYAVGGYDYDEDEYWSRQLEKALSYLDGDMAYEYFDFAHSEDDDEAEEERLHNQVLAVLKAELEGYDVIGRGEI